jgi:ABC-type sugar transport system substrate-binding protein
MKCLGGESMRKAIWLMLCLVFFGSILAGCVSSESAGSKSGSETTDNGSDSSDKIKIAVVPKLVGIPYFNASEVGAKRAGEELGVEVIYTGPTQGDAAQQVRVIEDLISQQVDVIAVAPNDSASLTPVLKKARDAGIHVMDWDTPADPEVVEISVSQIDNEAFGRHITQMLVEQMGTDSGDFAIVTGGMSAANLNLWIDWAMKEVEENYPNLNLVTEKIPTNEKQQEAYQKTLDLLRAYPELKGIMGFSTVAPLGAAQAIEERGLENDVALVGTALPTDSLPFLENGSLDVAALWDPEKLGYLTVALAKDLVEGKMPADGQEVPKVGKIEVRDKTVIMGPPTDFTADNAADYDF